MMNDRCTKCGQPRYKAIENDMNEATGTVVEAMITVESPKGKKKTDSETIINTYPATVRTRLIYKGQPAFLAGDA